MIVPLQGANQLAVIGIIVTARIPAGSAGLAYNPLTWLALFPIVGSCTALTTSAAFAGRLFASDLRWLWPSVLLIEIKRRPASGLGVVLPA